jgi:mRNA interferase MazF
MADFRGAEAARSSSGAVPYVREAGDLI